MAEAIRSLFKSGNFEDISAEREGDVLVFRLTERPSITEVKLEGNKAISEFARILSAVALATLRILPRIGRIA